MTEAIITLSLPVLIIILGLVVACMLQIYLNERRGVWI